MSDRIQAVPQGPLIHPEGSLESYLIQRNAIERCAKRMIEALDAETPQGNPDFRSRIQAAQAIMDRIEGKCVERQQVMIHKTTGAPSMEKLLSNDAGVESLRRLLAKADAKKKAKAAPTNGDAESA